MDFNEPAGRPDSATIEHLSDATFGSPRQRAQHRRLAHAQCNEARNGFRVRAERDFALWIAARTEAAEAKAEAAGVAVATAASKGDADDSEQPQPWSASRPAER